MVCFLQKPRNLGGQKEKRVHDKYRCMAAGQYAEIEVFEEGNEVLGEDTEFDADVVHKKSNKLAQPQDMDKSEKGCFSTSSHTEKGKSRVSKHITHGSHLVKGKSNFAMEDYLVSKFKRQDDNELGLFAIFNGHDVANYLQKHLLSNILKEPDFWTDTESAIKRAYGTTESDLLEQSLHLGKGGSTVITAILIDGQKLFVVNLGDSRAVISKRGVAEQLSVDHEPSKEKKSSERKGVFVSNLIGDVPRVDGQLAMDRAFCDKSLDIHLSSEPHVAIENIDDGVDFIILASDGLWKEAVESIKNIKDAQAAAEHLTEEARSRKSKDDISCIVVMFH